MQFISLFVVLVDVVLRLPAHEVTCEWKQQRVYSAPSNQDSEVYADT